MQLTEGWRATEADDDLRRAYYEDDFDDRDWEPIAVPGHWRSQGAFAASDGPLLHRCHFSHPAPAPGRRAWLTFDGLFYQGDHWLDGTYLGDTEGYFMPHTFEVTDQLRARADHTVALELACAPQSNRTAKRNITGVFQHWHALDPDWNPGGIWRPVHLSETGPVRIRHLRVLCRSADADRAVVALHAVLDSDAARSVRIHTAVGGTDHGADHPLAAGANSLDWTVTVPRPALWWPHALGDAVLHDVHVAVDLPAGEGAARSDERRLRTGLREVRMRNWVCRINGERLFLKGSNQGPNRMALGEAGPDELRRDVELAVDTGLDLLRLHAHVSRPELYDAADQAGLLLWQDMPLQWSYARGIRRQAIRQARDAVDLLGHHPSIVLWCGHNDPVSTPDIDPLGHWSEKLTVGLSTMARQQLPTWNKTMLDASLKRAFERADGTRPVVAHSGMPPHLPRLDGTDSHLYFGWYYGDERQLPGVCRAVPRMVRFVSEFGAQAVPSGEGAAFMEPGRWPDLDWDRLAHTHGLQLHGFQRYVPPDEHPSFESWRDATQDYQATLIKHHVETLRRLKYRPTGGFAHFCFADGHPAVSWSVLGHDRQAKRGLEALRQACRPVIVVAERPPAAVAPGDALALDVHVVSDRRDELTGAEISARLAWEGGDHSWSWTGDVAPDSCARVGTLQVVVPDTPGPLTLGLELRLPGGERVTNRYDSTIAPAPAP
jgi:beta-mannosidase